MDNHYIMKKSIKYLSDSINNIFVFLFILNLLSNYYILTNTANVQEFFLIITLAASIAFFENLFHTILLKKKLQYIYIGFLIVIYNILFVAESFSLTYFHRIINQDVIDIVAETNIEETINFLTSYTDIYWILLSFVLLFLGNRILYKVASFLAKFKKFNYFYLCLSLIGTIIYGYTAYNFIFYRNGMGIPQLTTITRIGYSFYITQNRSHDIKELSLICKETKASVENLKNAPHIIVIIGESYSLFHSSLYGYEKNTNPLLLQHVKNKNLFLFQDAVTTDDHTHSVMKSIYSLASQSNHFSQKPLFPACFKAAGYRTALYDNQYFIGNGITFLTDKELSNTLFHHRNTHRYSYDGDMIEDIHISDSISLYVIHLNGQHYTYNHQYPKEFQYFKAEDYIQTQHNIEQRNIIAHYDNATRYNDFVVNKIIHQFKDLNCCIIYFSDHGEEVYDCRDYMGHGNAAHSPNMDYQIQIPFMIYTSPSFQDNYPQMVERIKQSQNYPITSDDVPHLLLDIANIETEHFDPTRSCINEKYDTLRHRIVLNTIDFDARKLKN